MVQQAGMPQSEFAGDLANAGGSWKQAVLDQASTPVSRIAVDVTFLRMGRRPVEPPAPLPSGYAIAPVQTPEIAFYRYLYATVGQDYCWWLRRISTDQELRILLADPRISLSVLYHQGQPAGFFELDGRSGGEVNLSYFGLMPHQIGRGVGSCFLRAAIDAAWSRVRPMPGVGIRVNTCTADHPRALGAYTRAGFRPIRTVREIWAIPDHLGLPVPQALRV